jgi:hypothetical protein
MVSHNLIRVVKRAERERLGRLAAGGPRPEPSARNLARELAATVKGWVGEFEQNRPARLEELRRQLGWTEPEPEGLPRRAAGDSAMGEK